MRLAHSAHLALILAVASAGLAAHAQSATLASPDNQVQVEIHPAPLTYSVTWHGQRVLEDSPLGLDLASTPKDQPGTENFTLASQKQRSEDQTTTPVWGKSSPIRNHYNELTLDLASANHTALTLIVRAYNDGIALRYRLPAAGGSSFVVTRERTGFNFPGDPTVWATTYPSFHTSTEQHYPRLKLTDLTTEGIIGLPFLAQVSPNLYAAIAEADLTDWAGMSLRYTNTGLVANLSPRLDGNGLVAGTLPHDSPWRVLMLGATPGALIESSLIENLNPPSAIQDTSWIKPGMMAWDHWWSGDTKVDNETIESYIAFASEMHFPYQLIDWQWYGPYNEPTADITKPAPQLDWPGILAYAKAHHVREWLWLHSADVNRALEANTLDAAFSTYEQWGIAGVKIDFMDSDDQAMVNWYIKVVQHAAAHHLMVDFHGAFKDTGLRVTYPNLLTREGVLGNEYNKVTRRVTPTHKLTIPFTRMLVGPMDYTPGGFLNRSPAEWKQTIPTEVIGSRAQELALFVVYWSPLTCVTDSPENYKDKQGKPQPGLDFLRVVPTVWDETRVLDGSVGEHIVLARRNGKRWFVGGMTADNAYHYPLNLSFLGPGKYTAHLYLDPDLPASNTGGYEALTQLTKTVAAKDTLTLPMRPAGGAALYLEPVP